VWYRASGFNRYLRYREGGFNRCICVYVYMCVCVCVCVYMCVCVCVYVCAYIISKKGGRASYTRRHTKGNPVYNMGFIGRLVYMGWV
jgi:type IV secretory pathway VirB3-like protein